MKRFIYKSLLLLAIIITASASGFAQATWDGTIGSGFASGTGTSTNPYIIRTGAQLGYFLKSVSDGNTYSGKYIQLGNDITATSGASELTFSTSSNFAGKFDGNNHKLLNIKNVGWNPSYSYTCLFYNVSGTICNLSINNTSSYYGGLCYNLKSTGIIFNCFCEIKGAYSGWEHYRYAFAYNNEGQVVNCYAKGEISAGSWDYGLGRNNGGLVYNNLNSGVILNSTSEVTLYNGSGIPEQNKMYYSNSGLVDNSESTWMAWKSQHSEFNYDGPGSPKFTVTFYDSYGIYSTTTKEVTRNESIGTLPVPNVDCDFNGWTYNDGIIDETFKVTGDITLFASWTQRIKEQPTNNNPTVVVNDKNHASYQWYMANGNGEKYEDWASTNTGHGTTSSKIYTINATAGETLTFDWRVSSESECDILEVTINGTTIISKSGTDSGSETYTFTGSGTYTLTVSYTKDSSVSSGEDKAYVTNIHYGAHDALITGATSATLDKSLLVLYPSQCYCIIKYSNSSTVLQTDVVTVSNIVSGECGAEGANVVWSLNTVTGVLDISGTGNMKNYSNSEKSPWYEYRKDIKNIEINTGVTSIGSYAFYYCTSLTSVSIPNSVTSIGSYALYYCASLKSVSLPNSVTSSVFNTFYGCSSLTYVTGSAEDDNLIWSLDMTTGVLSVSGIGCMNDYTISDSAPWYKYNLHSYIKSVDISDGVTSIGSYAFYYCTSLTSVSIPNSVTSIGSHAFYNCTSLTSVSIPNSVTSIGSHAFNGCSQMSQVTLSDNLQYIYDYTFCNCSSLKSISIPEKVQVIYVAAFYGCSELSEIYVYWKDSWPIVGTAAFDGINKSNCTLYVPKGTVETYRTADVWKNFANIRTHILNVDLIDGENYTNEEDSECDALTFSKTFSASSVGKWNAFYVPMSIDVEEYAGELDFAEIYAFCATVDTNGDGTVDANDENFLFVRPVKTGCIEPNVPYLIRPKAAKTYVINSADNILYKSTEGKVEFSTTLDKFTVTGLNNAFTVTAGDNNYYVSASGALNIRTTGSATIKANRWIMHRESKRYGSNSVSEAKEFRIVAIGEDMDEVTAIETIQMANAEHGGNGDVFTIDGRKVDAENGLSRGIYIKNGKKYIVK